MVQTFVNLSLKLLLFAMVRGLLVCILSSLLDELSYVDLSLVVGRSKSESPLVGGKIDKHR